jgi:hypothetical protein
MSNYNFTKVLITGGAGGIGKALAQHMLSKGKVRRPPLPCLLPSLFAPSRFSQG